MLNRTLLMTRHMLDGTTMMTAILPYHEYMLC